MRPEKAPRLLLRCRLLCSHKPIFVLLRLSRRVRRVFMKNVMILFRTLLLPALAAALTIGCNSTNQSGTADKATTGAAKTDSGTRDPDLKGTEKTVLPGTDPAAVPAGKIADAATILARPEVPILCYHQVRDWRASDSKSARDYICPTSVFQAQLQLMADSGYHSILPDQLYAYLATGAALPAKPFMITFDDEPLDQYQTATPILEKLGFKASYYVMTVAIGRRGKTPYMDKTEIKDLVNRGHVVGCHTWDHHSVKKYTADDWKTQLDEPTEKIAAITGKPVQYFAYPFGLWNHEATVELKKRNYKLAYQLAERKRDPENPLLSVRRIIASGYWSPKTLLSNLKGTFNKREL